MAVAIPLALAAYSAYSTHQGNKQSAAERQAQAGQINASNILQAQGRQAFQTGFPAAQQSLHYYSTLLNGNRAAMSQAVAGPQAQLTDMYRGAERGIEHAGVRGGVRDLGIAELQRDKANQIGQLTTGVQPAAAAALANLGTTLTAQGTGSQATAGGLFGNVGQAGFQNRAYANQNNAQSGAAIGQAIFDAYRGSKYGSGKAAGRGNGTLMSGDF